MIVNSLSIVSCQQLNAPLEHVSLLTSALLVAQALTTMYKEVLPVSPASQAVGHLQVLNQATSACVSADVKRRIVLSGVCPVRFITKAL